MDLSGIIFVALALGWAVYLIPKALQRNEELARTRSVVAFSDRMRVLGSGRPVPDPVSTAPTQAPRPLISRQAAQRAAKRRRVVLTLLVFALGMVSGLAWFAIAPVWAPAVPGGLILVFLVVARISVRQQARRRIAVAPVAALDADSADRDEEDTASIEVGELVSARSMAEDHAGQTALADDGSLWDPLPVTLPTYVTKPTARRTVRTIELTAGPITSSGHSVADSALVKQVEAAQKQAKESEAAEGAQRKAAGA